MSFEALLVGELAKRTGLTVRTLHHYDEIGLLKPSLHSEGGYRLYTAADIARLQRVLSLRQLGFGLEEIRSCLDRPGFSPLEVIDLHVARLREQVAWQQKLCLQLEAIAGRLRAVEEVSAPEFLRIIEEMTMWEKYYTPQQVALIKERREQAGTALLNQKQEEWAELIALIRAEMDRGTDPASPKVQELAERWKQLLNESSLGDPAIQKSMKRHWEEEGDKLVEQYGAKYDSRPIWGYIGKATAILDSRA
jgi:DNA-binding transcriptional MerR regulator